MATGSTFPESVAGKFFFVSGLSDGIGVFVGRALDEPVDEQLTLEGKLVQVTPQGPVVAQPFNSQVRFFLLDATLTVHYICDPRAREEAAEFFDHSLTHVSAASFPFLHRWFRASAQPCFDSLQPPGPLHNPSGPHSFQGFFAGFLSTAEDFRRALFHAPQVSSARELDKVAELEGDLTVEIGKLTNQVAVKFHRIVSREVELRDHLEAFYGGEIPAKGTQVKEDSMGGFSYLIERMYFAKNFALRAGKSATIREINSIVKDGFFGLNEVVLDHCNSLDTLISETFSQYGIAHEIHGELFPFELAPLEQAREPSTHLSPAGVS